MSAETARLYVFVLVDIATRRVVHWNITEHPTADWTIQQFRNGLPLDAAYRFLVHDRDGIFAPAVDEALGAMALRVLRTPARAPQANAHCDASLEPPAANASIGSFHSTSDIFDRCWPSGFRTTTANDLIPP